MKRAKVLSMICIVFIIASCNKSDEPSTPDLQPSYIPMSVGDYWIYDWYEIDSLGTETASGIQDSIVITGDSLLNGQVYFTFSKYNNGNLKAPSFYRDSLGYLVDPYGFILFSPYTTSDTLYSYWVPNNGPDTIAFIYYTMLPDENISVPAGQFFAKHKQGTVEYYQTNHPNFNPAYVDTYFAQGVGRVYTSSIFLSSPHRLRVQKLVGYSVE